MTLRFPLSGAAAVAALALAAQPGGAEDAGTDTLGALVAALSAQAAEGFGALERQLRSLDPMLVDAAAPLVAGLIVDSRDDALEQGVDEVPPAIRAQIEDYVPAAVLDRVRWCAACGGTLSLQQGTFRLGYAPAITLDYVIVFKDRHDALTDPSLWVHELKHVMQFEAWGVGGFAARYLDDYAAVERDAAEYRWEWVKRNDWLERRKARRSSSTS